MSSRRDLCRPPMNLFRSMLVLLAATSFLFVSALQVFAEAETTGFITTYPVEGSPFNIVVEKTDHAWFTLPEGNAIGTMVVKGVDEYTFTLFEVPTSNAEPYDLAYRDGVIWFTQRAGNKIGKFDVVQLDFHEYEIPTPNSGPTGIDIAPNGRIWFLESAAKKLAVFDPATEGFIEYPIPAYISESRMETISVASSQRVWFTLPDVNRLVAYDVAREQFDASNTVSPTGAFTLPIGLAMDSKGSPWITAMGSNVIGRYTPETLSFFRWIPVPTQDSAPANLVFDDLGSTWSLFFTEAASGKVGRFRIRASDTKLIGISEHGINATGSAPWGIDVDSDGNVWVADPGANLVAVWRPPYEKLTYLPLISKQ